MDVVIGFAVYLLLIVALAVWRDHHDTDRHQRHRKPEGHAAGEPEVAPPAHRAGRAQHPEAHTSHVVSARRRSA